MKHGIENIINKMEAIHDMRADVGCFLWNSCILDFICFYFLLFTVCYTKVHLSKPKIHEFVVQVYIAEYLSSSRFRVSLLCSSCTAFPVILTWPGSPKRENQYHVCRSSIASMMPLHGYSSKSSPNLRISTKCGQTFGKLSWESLILLMDLGGNAILENMRGAI